MDKLIALYGQIKKLRESGVRLKDIAEETNVASSVLSSLYSSVIPSYARLIEEGHDVETALDRSLQLVNNISKRKLCGCIDDLYEKICHIEPRFIDRKDGTLSFFHEIEKELTKYVADACAYTGFYLAYSASSFSDGLKEEPYMITAPAGGDSVPKAYSQNMSGDYYTGVALLSPFQVGYLMFDEQKRTQLALKIVYLQLPVIEYPALLKGIYLTHDYNRNPIARRILLVRQGDEISLDDFSGLRTRVIPKDQLTEEQQAYYDYTCREGDIIRSLMLVSPEKDLNDLKNEKKILEQLMSSSIFSPTD